MYAIGIDIGGMSAKIGLIRNEKVVLEERIPTKSQMDYVQFVDEICRVVKKFSQGREIEKMGISSCGLINREKGAIIYSNNIKWENKRIVEDIKARTGLPVKIANDAKCAALAEAVWGGGRDYDRVCMITLGTGVGGGFICNKKMEDEGAYADGDGILGHITVEHNGRPCTCGRKGCLEAYASATAIMQIYQEKTQKRISAREIFQGYREGEREAEETIFLFRQYLGEGLISLVNVLRPEVIVLGGGVSGSTDLFLEYLRNVVNNGAYGGRFLPVQIVAAELGDAAGMIGAALL